MMKNNTIEPSLADFLREKGLNYEWRTTEHSGCWDKGCSHSEWELNIWHGSNRRFSWSFAEGCTPKMIETTLVSRMNEPWFKKVTQTA